MKASVKGNILGTDTRNDSAESREKEGLVSQLCEMRQPAGPSQGRSPDLRSKASFWADLTFSGPAGKKKKKKKGKEKKLTT